MFNSILVPVDGSANGKRALDAAVELAKCHNSSVILLHVIPDLPLPEEIVEMIAAGESIKYKNFYSIGHNRHILLQSEPFDLKIPVGKPLLGEMLAA
jgi:nucleotide-binding universal stress UspA family protein